MNIGHIVAYFFGGFFLCNALPHFLSGVMGRSFQSPFAKPPGKGLSSACVNVLWGSINLIIAYGLIFRIGEFDPRAWSDIVPAGAGFIGMGLLAAKLFGRFHGGDRV
jgi:hypothetical protein